MGHIDVALVTYSEKPDVTDDDRLLLDALQARGLRVAAQPWDGPFSWSEVEVAILRSPWDYHLRRDEFLAWVERVGRQTHMWNRPDTVRWNSHKGYLRDLEGRGIPIIDTVWIGKGKEADLRAIMQKQGWDEAVIKPVVSLSAYGTVRVGPANMEEGQAHLTAMLLEREMMVQPYMSAVEGTGERSLIYFNGEYSHTVRRAPALSLDPSENYVRAVSPAPDELALAQRTVHAAQYSTLYARVDLVRNINGEPRLMELELVEPSLFFTEVPGSAERMADALIYRLSAGE